MAIKGNNTNNIEKFNDLSLVSTIGSKVKGLLFWIVIDTKWLWTNCPSVKIKCNTASPFEYRLESNSKLFSTNPATNNTSKEFIRKITSAYTLADDSQVIVTFDETWPCSGDIREEVKLRWFSKLKFSAIVKLIPKFVLKVR